VRGRRGSRVVPASEFFTTYFTTAVAPDEMLTEVRVPRADPGDGTAVVELARRHGDFALAGIAAVVRLSGSKIELARLCAFGVDDVPRRLDDAERLLAGEEPGEELLAEAGRQAAQAVDPESDIHASAEYRREMTQVLTARAVREALEGAGWNQTEEKQSG
jgi:aerobic carbon-monoxide dehydrogenase medium subunit